MRDQMLNHGLNQPLIGTDTGYFQITFPSRMMKKPCNLKIAKMSR